MMLRERAPNLTENLPSAAFKRHAHREAEDDFEAYRVIQKSKHPQKICQVDIPILKDTASKKADAATPLRARI